MLRSPAAEWPRPKGRYASLADVPACSAKHADEAGTRPVRTSGNCPGRHDSKLSCSWTLRKYAMDFVASMLRYRYFGGYIQSNVTVAFRSANGDSAAIRPKGDSTDADHHENLSNPYAHCFRNHCPFACAGRRETTAAQALSFDLQLRRPCCLHGRGRRLETVDREPVRAFGGESGRCVVLV